MNVTLKGASQGVDFITKMVGSTHGRGGTRIKDANITLNIDSPHLFQDEQKIVNRLINGINNKENNNTIKKISIDNSLGKCLHPACKTNSLKSWLEYNKKALNNVTIEDLRAPASNQQNTLY